MDSPARQDIESGQNEQMLRQNPNNSGSINNGANAKLQHPFDSRIVSSPTDKFPENYPQNIRQNIPHTQEYPVRNSTG